MELRGEMRSDKFPEEWAEFIVETWCSDRCTRASERSTKCATRTPRKALALQVQAQLIGHGEIIVVMNGDPEHGAQEPFFIGEAAALYDTSRRSWDHLHLGAR